MQGDVDARYDYGIPFIRIRAINDDGSSPGVSNVIGGAGPFDYSGASAPAAIPITYKIDNATAVSSTIDLSGAADDEAVTAAEVAAAITAQVALAALAASVNSDGRVKIALATPGTHTCLQVYGLAAELCNIGQGLGVKWIKIDTHESLAEKVTLKADTTKTVTDANGRDTEVIRAGYRKGAVYTLIDDASDSNLRVIMEGGTLNATTGAYEAPTDASPHYLFEVEAFTASYKKGSNKVGDLVGYKKQWIKSAQGSVGDSTKADDFDKKTYTITATSFKETSGAISGDMVITPMTVAVYNALDVANV